MSSRWSELLEKSFDLVPPLDGPLGAEQVPVETLVEKIWQDQRRRQASGEVLPAEYYLQRFPLLLENPECAVDVVYHEFVLAERCGDSVSPESFLSRFPDFQVQLRRQFTLSSALTQSEWKTFDAPFDPPSKETESTCSKPVTSRPNVPKRFTSLKEIGRGGMGVVYRAKEQGLGRIVALKVILGGHHAEPRMLRRFQSEAESIAKLQHPNIVQIWEIGQHDGLPYIALEYINGGTLAAYLRDRNLSSRDAAVLVQRLAVAVDYAHRQGIIHRDLKPANVLLASASETEATATSVLFPNQEHFIPKITDFGLAKQLQAEGGVTQTGDLFGTPSYMAPENTQGERLAHPASDIYALGAILYETLTSRPPFVGESLVATIEKIRLHEPLSPSQLVAGVDRDLETICLKCLEKAPRKRYPSAQELVRDLDRYLSGVPIAARPIGRSERILRWADRNRFVAVAMTLIVGGFLAICALSIFAAGHFRRLARDAGHSKRLAEGQAMIVDDIAQFQRRQLYASQMVSASHAADMPTGIGRVRQIIQHWKPSPGQQDLRGWEWFYLQNLLNSHVSEIGNSATSGHEVEWCKRDSSVLCVAPDGIFQYDVSHGMLQKSISLGSAAVTGGRWQRDQSRVAIGLHGRRIRVYDWLAGKIEHEFGPLPAEIAGVRLHNGGRWLAATFTDGNGAIWDLENDRKVYRFFGGQFQGECLEFHPSLPQLAFKTYQSIRVVDFFRDIVLWETEAQPHQIAWNGSGSMIAWANHDVIKMVSCRDWKLEHGFPGPGDRVRRIRWNLAETMMAIACADGNVHVMDVETGECSHRFRGHSHEAMSVDWSPKGDRLVSSGRYDPIRVWSRAEPQPLSLIDAGAFGCADWLNGGQTIAYVYKNGIRRLELSNPMSAPTKWIDSSAGEPWNSVAMQPGGDWLACLDRTGRLVLVDATSPTTEFELTPRTGNLLHPSNADAKLSWTEDGRWLAAVTDADVITLWNTDSLERIRSVDVGSLVCSVTFSPDGSKLAYSSYAGIEILDMRTGQLYRYQFFSEDVEWNPDSSKLLVQRSHSEELFGIVVLDPADGSFGQTFLGATRDIKSLAWSPDGSRIAAGCDDGSIYVWDASSTHLLAQIADHHRPVSWVRWRPDGQQLMSGAAHEIRVRDAGKVPPLVTKSP